MTLPRLRMPALIAIPIIILAVAIELWFPPRVAMAIRLANGFLITTLLVAYIRRNLRYDEKLDAHRQEMFAIVQQDAEFRKTHILLLLDQISVLESKLKLIQQTHRRVADTATKQGRVITEKLDEMMRPKRTRKARR
jgi:hypothetical protein